MASWSEGRKKLQKFVATAGLYLALGVWVVVGVISFLVHFHLIPENINVFPVEQMPALALVTGLFWILSEQAKDAEEEAQKALATLSGGVQRLGHKVEDLVSNLSPQLRLLDCLEEFKEDLNQVPPDDLIEIDHLGLDMHTAWQHIRETFLYSGRMQKKIRYRLLMLTGDIAEMGTSAAPAGKAMATMCGIAKNSLENINEFLATEQAAIANVSVEIRIYKEFPVVHGFKVNRPEQAHYVSFFRWSGARFTEYNWGEGRYHRIKSAAAQTSIRDIADIFDSYFEHLWNVSRPEYPRPSRPA